MTQDMDYMQDEEEFWTAPRFDIWIEPGQITNRKSGVNSIQLFTVECGVYCTIWNKLEMNYPLKFQETHKTTL